MGAVYHARDTRLDRSVAVKVLAGRPGMREYARERLEGEARAISRITHPHVCTLHDISSARVGDSEIQFLVMELLAGETLATVLSRGPLPSDVAVQHALEIADALACAHRHGIVHRDLKPQNIMITSGGIKLLDFGLASFTTAAPIPTIAEGSTASRPLVGTARYMSPEQIRGEQIDGRADLFSLGLVFHEMLTATRAFDRPTVGETLDAILQDPPPPLPESVSGDLQRIIARCLEKNRDLRFQTAEELGAALRQLSPTVPRDDALSPPAGTSHGARALVLGAGVLIAVAAVAWVRHEVPAPRVTGYVKLTNDEQQKSGGLVTDGSLIYVSEHVDNRPVLVKVPVTGGSSTPIAVPFPEPGLDDIAPDGSGLIVGSYAGPYPFPYWLVPTNAGEARPLGELRAHDVHFSPDGDQMAYIVGSDLYVSKRDGSGRRKLTMLANRSLGSAAWAPDGRRLRFTVGDAGQSSLWEIGTDGAGLRPLLPGWNTPAAECCGRWTPDGAYFIFQSRQNGVTSLWAIREPGRWQWRRSAQRPVQLTTGPLHFRSPTPSKDGRRIFAIGDQIRGEIMRRNPSSGEWTPLALGSSVRSISSLEYSRRGDWVAYVTYPEATLWRSRPDDTDRQQLTFPPMEVAGPSWSPDADRIVFMARKPGHPWKLHVAARTGGEAIPLLDGQENEAAPAWSPDGHEIVFSGSPFFDPRAKGPTALHVLDLRTRRVSKLPGSEGIWAVRWSPDGRYLVGHRFDFRQLMLFDVAAGKWETLASGILHFANWSSDSEYVYFERWGNDIGAMRIRIRDRRQEKIGSLKEFRRTIGPERCWSGLTPDNAFLVLRDIGSQEVYALSWDAH